jgi:hypothetical protein
VDAHRSDVRGAAGRRHQDVAASHPLLKIAGFRVGGNVGAQGNLDGTGKTRPSQRFLKLSRRGAELGGDRGGVKGDDALPRHDAGDHVDELSLVHHRTEGTLAHARAAEGALRVVDPFLPAFVLRDRADGDTLPTQGTGTLTIA